MSKVTTIEDVLAKHAKNYKKTVEENEKSLYHLVLNGFEAINFAKEWASLTPSNEKYGWVRADENWEDEILYGKHLRMVETKEPVPYRAVAKSVSFGNKWIECWCGTFDIKSYQAEKVEYYLESTPIPLTPCVELEKEVERLKGLLHGQAYSVWKGCSSDLTFEEWYKLYQNNL